MTLHPFGPFTLDTDAAEVRKGKKKIALRPKCFDVLAYLLERRGRLVTKEELLDAVWRDVVVDDGTISRTVAELRAALDGGEFIETVARRGYKFAGETTRLALIHGANEHPLREGSQIIGRSDDADIPLYTPSTSRRHARIDVHENDVTLTDLGSRHGTVVNGNMVKETVRLAPGDQIEIGGERLILWSPASETSPEPPFPSSPGAATGR